MKKYFPLQDRAEIVVNAWEKHLKFYYETQHEIAELKATVLAMRLEMHKVEERVAWSREKLAEASPVQRADIEPDILAIEQRIVQNRKKFAQRDSSIKKLEQKLETTWDIWTNDWTLK